MIGARLERSPVRMMRIARGSHMLDAMTLHEHIEQTSFAYCDELPPDVAEGLPLSAARGKREQQPSMAKRAFGACRRAVSRRR
jgi:hypothetical protein